MAETGQGQNLKLSPEKAIFYFQKYFFDKKHSKAPSKYRWQGTL